MRMTVAAIPQQPARAIASAGPRTCASAPASTKPSPCSVMRPAEFSVIARANSAGGAASRTRPSKPERVQAAGAGHDEERERGRDRRVPCEDEVGDEARGGGGRDEPPLLSPREQPDSGDVSRDESDGNATSHQPTSVVDPPCCET